jgi:RNA polymerase subunit RPABC4/transcription elongation factor Spt4
MALLNCKECNAKVSTKAKRCPSCGAKVPKKIKFKWYESLIIMIVIAFIIHNPIKNFVDGLYEIGELKNQTKERAAATCSYYIKQLLKDPSSSNFSYINTSYYQSKDKSLIVSIPFTGKNSFNATISNTAVCKLAHTQHDGWKILAGNILS